MRRIVPVKGHAGDATPGMAYPLFDLIPFCMTCQRPVCLAWHRRCCDGQQSTTIFIRPKARHTKKPHQRLKGMPWIHIFSSVLPHFPSRRRHKRRSNPPSEGANAFYGHKHGPKRGSKPPTCRSKGPQSQSERHSRRSDACHRRTFRCRPSSSRQPSE